MDIKEAPLLGKDAMCHWYFRSKAAAVEKLLGAQQFNTLLDIGAGSGFFSRELVSRNIVLEAYCVDINYADEHDELICGKPLHYRRRADSVAADLVLLMDVLEHVDDDLGLLRDQVRNARPGTLFLLSVPAFQFLWSGHDEFLEHRRRYTLRQLEHVVTEAGLHIERGGYYYALIFPIAAVVRLWQKLLHRTTQPKSNLRPHSAFVNGMLTAICKLECSVLGVNRAFGLTAFCVARRD